MIIAVITMGMVQMAVYQIIHMISMWHLWVTTVGPVNVILAMTRAVVVWSALLGVGFVHLKMVLIDVPFMHMV